MLTAAAHAAIDRTRAARAEIDAILAGVPSSGDEEHPEVRPPQDFPTLEWVELAYVQRVLEAAGGNKSAAAKVLGSTPIADPADPRSERGRQAIRG